MAHEVNVNADDLDRAFRTFEALPSPGAESAPKPDPTNGWQSFADMVGHSLHGVAPNWRIDELRRANFSNALARFMGEIAPAGPGDPGQWPAWLSLAFASGAIVAADGMDWQEWRLKPLGVDLVGGQDDDANDHGDAPFAGRFTTQ